MSLIANLKNNFEAVLAAAPAKAPQNLGELVTLLETVCHTGLVRPDLPFYCNWYSEHVQRIHDQENQGMAKTRGKARRMWAEQSLIYQDLIVLLKDLAVKALECQANYLQEKTEELAELVDELDEALAEMEDWNLGQETRCLGCGWNGPTGHCPHCQLQVLKPVRRYSSEVNNYVALSPLQAQLFQGIKAVLEGQQDVRLLRLPLQQLQKGYQEALLEVQAQPHLEFAQVALATIPQALVGLEQIERVFTDHDAQHLEDGWATIFQANQAVVATIESQVALADAYDVICDQVSMSNQ